jgi:hypothetical protein
MKKKAGKPKKTRVRITDLRTKSNPKGGQKRNPTIGGASIGFTKIHLD